MAVFKKRTAAPTPEREALALAIAERDAFITAAAETDAKAARAQGVIWDAQAAVQAATEAHRDALAAAGAAAFGPGTGDGSGPAPVRATRTAIVDAQDRLDALRLAREQLEADVQEHKYRRPFIDIRVRDAADAVVRAEASEVARQVTEALVRLQSELVAHAAATAWLLEHGAIPLSEKTFSHGQPADDEARIAHNRMQVAPLDWHALRSKTHPRGAGPWEAAFAALLADATAPLPVTT